MARKREVKYFVYSLLPLQVSWKGFDVAVNVPFLTTSVKQSLRRLLAASQEQALILGILAGRALVQYVQIIPYKHT